MDQNLENLDKKQRKKINQKVSGLALGLNPLKMQSVFEERKVANEKCMGSQFRTAR